jgi:hypothetical protein
MQSLFTWHIDVRRSTKVLFPDVAQRLDPTVHYHVNGILANLFQLQLQ